MHHASGVRTRNQGGYWPALSRVWVSGPPPPPPPPRPGLPTAEATETTAEPTPHIDFKEDAPPTTFPADLGEDTAADIQLEPTQDEMERERLIARAEQVRASYITCIVST